jgi:Zn-dependent M16 (insulinase) family peptidase
MENQVLPDYTKNMELDSKLHMEQTLTEPVIRTENFMPDLMQEQDKQQKLGISYLLDIIPAKDPYEAFCLSVLSNLLLEGPNAPFY